MGKMIKRVFLVLSISALAFSCKSNSDYLKEAATTVTKLADAMVSAEYEVDFDRFVAEYNRYMENLPSSIQEMSEDEIVTIDGGQEYVEAIAYFHDVYSELRNYYKQHPGVRLPGGYDDPDSIGENAAAGNASSTQLSAPNASGVFDENKGVIKEDNYILMPGVTYVTESSWNSTDELGGEVSLSMEFTIYKDGSVTGNLIETNLYGRHNTYEHPLEGTWEEVSKHDKRFLKIYLELQADDYNKEFTYYIDESLNAYANDINTRPVKLMKK